MGIVLEFLPGFLLVFCRITSFFVTAPIYSTRNVPMHFKIGLSFFITLLVFLTVGFPTSIDWNSTYVLLLIREVLVGVLLGFIAYLFFTVVQIAGSFIDLQMGFGIVNVIDPMTGAQSPVFGNFKFFIATLLFLAINGHHYLLMGIMNSYEWVPLENQLFAAILDGGISNFLLQTLSTMFVLAFQLAAPLSAAIFIVDIGLGMLARTVPQFNIFVIGLPTKILVGFLIIFVMVPSFLYLFQLLFSQLFEAMNDMLMIIRG